MKNFFGGDYLFLFGRDPPCCAAARAKIGWCRLRSHQLALDRRAAQQKPNHSWQIGEINIGQLAVGPLGDGIEIP